MVKTKTTWTISETNKLPPVDNQKFQKHFDKIRKVLEDAGFSVKASSKNYEPNTEVIMTLKSCCVKFWKNGNFRFSRSLTPEEAEKLLMILLQKKIPAWITDKIPLKNIRVKTTNPCKETHIKQYDRCTLQNVEMYGPTVPLPIL